MQLMKKKKTRKIEHKVSKEKFNLLYQRNEELIDVYRNIPKRLLKEFTSNW